MSDWRDGEPMCCWCDEPADHRNHRRPGHVFRTSREYSAERRRLDAAARVRRMLVDPYILMPNSAHRGISRAYSLHFLKTGPLKLDIPVGWTMVRNENRGVGHLMPWWLAVFVIIRRDWQHFLFGKLLMPLGLWEVRREGGFYVGCDSAPTLPKWLRAFVYCFLNDRDHMNTWLRVRLVQYSGPDQIIWSQGVQDDIMELQRQMDEKRLARRLKKWAAETFAGKHDSPEWAALKAAGRMETLNAAYRRMNPGMGRML